ncbi:MAG: hypothetical protein ACRESZ_09765 [Methylococcales bacterium]
MQDVLDLLAPRDEAIAALSKSVDLGKSVELIVSKLAIWDAQEQQEQKVNSGTIQPVIEIQDTVKGLVDSFALMNSKLEGVKFISKDNCRELADEVLASAAGIVDEKIAKLVMPKDGIDGRDALDIQIEPRIDETKNVPRGTYAIHAGGLWRAHQKTSGMRGWECVVDGISDVALNEAGPRTIVLSVTRSSGEEVQKTFDFPVMLYKGVYEPGQDYAIGDVATFGGSLWHCNAKTDDKPGVSEAWTLCVKRGRDGKDRVSI